MIRSIRNSQRLGRESFLIPTHVFQLTKSSFYHIKRIALELNYGFRTLFEVGMFFLLWDLKNGVRISNLKTLIEF